MKHGAANWLLINLSLVQTLDRLIYYRSPKKKIEKEIQCKKDMHNSLHSTLSVMYD